MSATNVMDVDALTPPALFMVVTLIDLLSAALVVHVAVLVAGFPATVPDE